MHKIRKKKDALYGVYLDEFFQVSSFLLSIVCKKKEHTLNHVNKQVTKVALITGACSSHWAYIARHLHEAGYRVIIQYHHSQQEAQALCDTLNKNRPESAILIGANLTVKEAAVNLIHQAHAWGARLDLVVNNASRYTKTI